MAKTYTPEEMLTVLSHRGDPAAFYRLLSPFLQARYVAERSAGQTHQRCLEYLLPGVAKMYSAFCKARPAQASEWIEQHTQGTARMTPHSQNDEVVLEKIDAAGLNDFDRKAQRAILQQYHLLCGNERLDERGYRGRARVLAWGGGILMLCALVVVAGLLLRPLSLALTIHGHHLSLNVPLEGAPQIAPPPPVPAAMPPLTNAKPVEAAALGERAHESMSEPPRRSATVAPASPAGNAPQSVRSPQVSRALAEEAVAQKPATATGLTTPPSPSATAPAGPGPGPTRSAASQPTYRAPAPAAAPANPSAGRSTTSTAPAEQ
jgi:hypothetical protein